MDNNTDSKNIVSIEDRIPKLKHARKKKANRRMISYICIFFCLISIIVYLQSPLSKIKKLAVTGNSYLTDQEIIQQSKLTKNTNIWSVNKKGNSPKIRKKIQSSKA
ncbi:FtsQ-type POTRA domain-containing protein [Virgibacillus halophilus]|uniref:FtsQ-type POTRA domain-containing protein n=1 Tax=Tigheibacillus halophilus TaxID=361280 RepID=A0ABU5CAN3_9BACI|nr:FtsQ-type POTRA domain-containing protein [Virgibacillus halophilus]